MPGASIDDVLQLEIGEFGRGQTQILLVASQAWTVVGALIYLMFFTALDPVTQGWVTCLNEDCLVAVTRTHNTEALCGLNSTAYKWTYPQYSVVSDFDLICSRQWLASLLGTGFMVGFTVGGGVFGYVCARYGRKTTLYAVLAGCGLSNLLGVAFHSYWVHLLSQFVTGTGVAGAYIGATIIVTEPIGPRLRGRYSMLSMTFFMLGEVLLGCTSWLFPNWRVNMAMISLLCFIFVTTWYFVPESPRWLLQQGRTQECTEVLQWIASKNGTRLVTTDLVDSSDSVQRKTTLLTALSNPKMRFYFVALSYTYIAISLAYYGVSLSLGALQGSVYLNFIWMSITEATAYLPLAFVIDQFGRCLMVSVSLLTATVSVVTCGFLATSAWGVVFAAIGKMSSSVAIGCFFVYTPELVPTSVRSSMLGTSSLLGRLGAIAAPNLMLLGTWTHYAPAPFFLMGAATLIAACLWMFLPETKGQPQPETLEQTVSMSDSTLWHHSTSLIKRMSSRYYEPINISTSGSHSSGEEVLE